MSEEWTNTTGSGRQRSLLSLSNRISPTPDPHFEKAGKALEEDRHGPSRSKSTVWTGHCRDTAFGWGVSPGHPAPRVSLVWTGHLRLLPGFGGEVARHLWIILRHAPSRSKSIVWTIDFRDVVGCSAAGEVTGKRWGESGILHHSGRPASLSPSSHLENTLDRSFKYLPRLDTRNSGSSVRTFAKAFSAS